MSFRWTATPRYEPWSLKSGPFWGKPRESTGGVGGEVGGSTFCFFCVGGQSSAFVFWGVAYFEYVLKCVFHHFWELRASF